MLTRELKDLDRSAYSRNRPSMKGLRDVLQSTTTEINSVPSSSDEKCDQWGFKILDHFP